MKMAATSNPRALRALRRFSSESFLLGRGSSTRSAAPHLTAPKLFSAPSALSGFDFLNSRRLGGELFLLPVQTPRLRVSASTLRRSYSTRSATPHLTASKLFSARSEEHTSEL